jgi:hypothetical protein
MNYMPVQVMDNNNINADPRHQAISAAADGVPFFKDRNAANGWPCVLYPENAPVGRSRSNEDAHMVFLVPSEYKTEDEEGRVIVVKKYVVHDECCMYPDEVFGASCQSHNSRV